MLSRLIGDFGYDPLNLGKNPEALKWYVQAEIIHGRLAMMGLAGMLIPSVRFNTSLASVTSLTSVRRIFQALTKIGILNTPEWYEAGKVAIDGSGIPFSIPTTSLHDLQIEFYRLCL